MPRLLSLYLHICYVFYLSLSACVNAASAADQNTFFPQPNTATRKGYSKGDLMPVSCMNRTLETGEHITDDHGNLQYIPFPTCNETSLPLAFPFNTPQTQLCTIDALPDELYHLFEFFVHSDVPLTCRVPTYPFSPSSNPFDTQGSKKDVSADLDTWTPFTINVLFHTSNSTLEPPHLLASTAYSLPNSSSSAAREGTKIMRFEPLVLIFNVGWIDGTVLPGMVGRPVLGVKDHSVGFSLLSFFALMASAGVGAIGMLVYERKKSGRSGGYGNGILGGNIGSGSAARNTGYGGYGGYSSGVGKRD
jgi:hypothetical protein